MAPTRLSNPHIKPLEQALAARYGWQGGTPWRREKLMAAVDNKASKLGMDEFAYCRMAATSSAELEVLAELISNSETRFFREPDQFAALKETVVPHLIQARAKERRLDLWSAACSTGEEAYSLAILVCESLPEGAQWETNLMATDLRGPAIIYASQGSYPSSAIRMIDPQIRHKYFVKAGMSGRERQYEVVPALRKMVAFRRANVYDSKFWKNLNHHFDLIICNNLLLYFHALAVEQTVARIAGVLKRGGILMVMKNETNYVDHPRLKLETSLPGSFFRKV
ncbi:MAG TPA: CheR family methyltransferase [Blastocatellia bacterium]|jgi:chemotaxis protein methyltransferase CheR|nr:CheR family methyltransferase [Blastocatellia bacterium]